LKPPWPMIVLSSVREAAEGSSLIAGVCDEALRCVHRDGVSEFCDSIQGDATRPA
jgi:hypothetical protein